MASPSAAPVLDRKDNLILRRMLPRDVAAHHRVMTSAFGGDIHRVFYPNGETPEDVAWTHALLTKHITAAAPDTVYLAAIDTASPPLPADLAALAAPDRAAATAEGRLAGFSVWHVHPHERTPAALAAAAAAASADGLSPTRSRAASEAFAAAVRDCKARLLGPRPYVLLHVLGTDPAYHRRGVGSLHMRWGLAEQDRLGVVGYLEATDVGRPLYERLGYRAVERLPFDSLRFGDVRIEHTIMIRPAGGGST